MEASEVKTESHVSSSSFCSSCNYVVKCIGLLLQYDTMYQYLTCAERLTSTQLYLLLGIKTKSSCNELTMCKSVEHQKSENR